VRPLPYPHDRYETARVEQRRLAEAGHRTAVTARIAIIAIMIYLVRAMHGGLQSAKLLPFGPIGLCTDDVIRFVQMLQCVDVFALFETLAPGQVFLLILFDLHEAWSETIVSR
jgi:hypothetical protein